MLVKVSAVLLCLCALCNVGCFGLSFGGTQGEVHHTHTHTYSAPTLAQELTELKKIRREGVLSENEYAVAKNKLINEYNSDVKAMEMAQGHVSSIEQVSHEQTTDRSNAQTNFISTQPAVSIPLGDLNPLNESTP